VASKTTDETIGDTGYRWEVDTDAAAVHVKLLTDDLQLGWTQMAYRKRLYKDGCPGREPVSPFDLAARLMQEIRLEVKRTQR
jgi:hypothetical protein